MCNDDYFTYRGFYEKSSTDEYGTEIGFIKAGPLDNRAYISKYVTEEEDLLCAVETDNKEGEGMCLFLKIVYPGNWM